MVRFLFIKEMLEFTIFTCAIIAIANLLGWLILTQTLHDLATSSLLVNRESPAVNQNIRRINTLTKEVVFASAGYIPFTPYVITLAQNLPKNISLSALNIDRGDGIVSLSGVAKTRAALLDYQKTIATIPWLENPTTPTSQLFQKENIAFEIRAHIKDSR